MRALDALDRAALVYFVSQIEPDARLRDKPGLNVRVDRHLVPPGGPEIPVELSSILAAAWRVDPPDRYNLAYRTHVAYETLHPFTDGNGRSGRALWLWQMGGIDHVPLGFLHTVYHQALADSRP